MIYEQREGKTVFSLVTGTVLRFGSEDVMLESAATFSVPKLISQTAVEETIQGSGLANYGLNLPDFNGAAAEQPKAKKTKGK